MVHFNNGRTLTSGKISSSLDSSSIRVGAFKAEGAGSGVSSVLLSSDAVPEPEGLGMSSSLGVGGRGFLVSSLGYNLSELDPMETHPVGTRAFSEKKLMSKRFWN